MKKHIMTINIGYTIKLKCKNVPLKDSHSNTVLVHCASLLLTLTICYYRSLKCPLIEEKGRFIKKPATKSKFITNTTDKKDSAQAHVINRT